MSGTWDVLPFLYFDLNTFRNVSFKYLDRSIFPTIQLGQGVCVPISILQQNNLNLKDPKQKIKSSILVAQYNQYVFLETSKDKVRNMSCSRLISLTNQNHWSLGLLKSFSTKILLTCLEKKCCADLEMIPK